MKIILSADVKSLGKKGETVEVREGYARNFILPRGLGVEATPANIKGREREEKRSREKAAGEKRDAENLAAEIEKTALKIKRKAGENGKLFGAVTNKDVAKELEKKGLKIDRRKVEMNDIKQTGSYKAEIKLHHEVKAEVTVTVENQ